MMKTMLGLMGLIGLIGLALAGCGDQSMMAAACAGGDEQAAVMTKFVFARQMPQGVSVGFDVDHHVAVLGDPLTCGHASLTSPDGTKGIDNQLSQLLPAIDAQTNGAIDSIIQGGINNGMLLIGIDLQHVTSGVNDPCVDLATSHLLGTPTLGTDMVLDANQTFSIAGDVRVSHTMATIKEHVLLAGPFELAIPVSLLDAKFTMNVHTAYLRATVADDGSMSGSLGGGIYASDVIAASMNFNIETKLKSLIANLLTSSADLDKDPMTGDCRQLSVAVSFEAKNAFFNP